jgi:hypothetical protein
MGQVSILNTTPELAITSCNTICNSKITCIEIIPPSSQISNSKPKIRESLLKSLILPKTETVESLVISESSDDEESVLNRPILDEKSDYPNASYVFNVNSFEDNTGRENKYSSIWFGTEDGRFEL